MLQKTSVLRLVMTGILIILLVSVVFSAPKIVIEILTISFFIVFWVQYFAMRNSLNLWETIPVAIFFIFFYFLIFSGSLLWLLYFILCIFWYVLSDYFFPNIFAGMIVQKKGNDNPLLLAVAIYFFLIPGIVFFFTFNVLSAIFA